MAATTLRMDGQAVLARYWRHLAGSAKREDYYSAAKSWYAICRRGLWAGEMPTEEDTRWYVSQLRASGLADTTIDWRLRAIATMYRRSRVRLPRQRLSLDTQNESVALSPELVAHLIGHARGGTFAPTQRAMLAVATLYGARVSELAKLTTRDVDLQSRRIRIPTSKGGVVRWQRIPEAAVWALTAPWRVRSATSASADFKAVCSLAGVPQPSGVGWHAVRHALAIGLKGAGLSPEDRSRFMRWQTPGGETRMADRYADVTVIATVSGIRSTRDADDPDAAVWAAHPFLPLWRRG